VVIVEISESDLSAILSPVQLMKEAGVVVARRKRKELKPRANRSQRARSLQIYKHLDYKLEFMIKIDHILF